MLIGDVLRKKPEATKILAEFGMGCLGCPSSQMESIEDAAKVHGLEVEKILKSLNKD
ncbi:MAG: disulfide oxidoreductase [Desulfitibacter sp. BRH_c19]|nr:MAG: disulfide oxidoreductase [Desulfitibacter sp. BRH_c19]